MKQLFFGNNLDVLQEHVEDESVDLVYLDPPFNSKAEYNVLYETPENMRETAQRTAFKDTWTWEEEAQFCFEQILDNGGMIAGIVRALREALGKSDMMAYLVMMAARLIQIHRTLKPTGSLYLHCDPTASHYLKIICDAIFGPEFFRNEIVWRRTGSHNTAKRYGPIHDTILFYTKSKTYFWRRQTRPYMRGHVEKAFIKEGERYRTNYSGNVLTGSGRRPGGVSSQPWKGFEPDRKGRHWAIPSKLLEGLPDDISEYGQHEKMDYLYEKGFITIKPGDEWPRYQRYITKDEGQYLSDIWAYQPYTEGTVFGTDEGIDADVRWMGSKDGERVGYPTQKPLSLMRRIIEASSNPGDVVLDPFCGCGTTVHAATEMKRNWIGIDVSYFAVKLIERRLKANFPAVGPQIEMTGIPADLPSAEALAERDPYGFQQWAVDELGCQFWKEGKKGADGGVDGEMWFYAGPNKTGRLLVQVKGGRNVGAPMVREFKSAMSDNSGDMGIFFCRAEPTADMRREAASLGFYRLGSDLSPGKSLI